VREDNRAAIKLYGKFGFVENCRLENYYNFVDGLEMEFSYEKNNK
jgi:ribosomal protein S18 acetylase RimI-like enzyme